MNIADTIYLINGATCREIQIGRLWIGFLKWKYWCWNNRWHLFLLNVIVRKTNERNKRR